MPGSVSVGFATVQGDQKPAERLAAADAAMYMAKRAGGNRVCEVGPLVALPPLPPPPQAVAFEMPAKAEQAR
jgi:hypothetical protein